MKNYWNIAVVISLLFHVAIVTEGSQLFEKKTIKVKKKNTKEIEITPKRIEKIKELTAKEKVDLNTPKPLPYIDNLLGKLIDSDSSSLEKPNIFDNEAKEVVFSQSLDETKLKKNPAYMNYYRLIREKIRSNTYHNYNTNRRGEVLVGFLILKDGTLKDVRLSPESVGNRTLRDIALESIKEAAPFPVFPEELKKYSQLRFNISIYFKNN